MLMPSIFGENLFNDDWMNFSFPEVDKELYGKHAGNVMKTDVRETDSGYEVDIDLPGFKKDEINAQLDNGYLTISASKGLDKEEKNKEGKYIRKERYAGAMSRSFYVGDEVTQADIKARYEDGILRLSVPIGNDPLFIFVDRRLELFERKHGLTERLDDRNAAHVLDRLVRHRRERVSVLTHLLRHALAGHRGHYREAEKNRNKTVR